MSDRSARRHAPREAEENWLIGPDRDVIVFHLQAAGALPTAANVARLRRASLLVMADLLRAHAGPYLKPPDVFAAVAAGAVWTGAPLPGDAASIIESPPIEPAASSEVQPDLGSDRPAMVAQPSASFLAKVDDLICRKTQAKRREWDDKTARQHRSVAKLFVKCAGTDDPATLTQAHIGRFFDLLGVIPTYWGKSADEKHRTIEEIVARSDDLDDNEIGLSAATFNRYRTQLGAILKYMEEHGFPIGVVKAPRAVDPEGPETSATPSPSMRERS